MANVILERSPQLRFRNAARVETQHIARLEYLAEGNANIVYAFKPYTQDSGLPVSLQGRLLRLRKDKDFIQTTASQLSTFSEHFAPLFKSEHLLKHTLVAIDREVINSLNENLADLERSGRRDRLRHDDNLATNEQYGLLVTDMTARSNEFLLEIKPKWLLQSPDAPQDALRCRTCALRVQRIAERSKGAITPNVGIFCPLRLVADNLEDRRRAFEVIVKSQAGSIPQHTVHVIVQFLAEEGYRILRDLRYHQERLDPTGLLDIHDNNVPDAYMKAMTLRDCLLFVRGSLDDFANTAEIRLADLDFKHAHPDKVAKWKGTERKLLGEGWYTNNEADGDSPSVCVFAQRLVGDT